MTSISETPKWESDIYQISRLDKVEGGRDGVANKQAAQIANRTLYLKNEVDRLSDAAYSGANIYQTKDEGILKTSEGEFFKVPESGISSVSYILYQNQSGVAVEVLREASPYISGYQAATSAGSSAENTIEITIPGLLSDGALLYFVSPVTNTGPCTIKVTDIRGNSATRLLLTGPNSPLSAGDLLANNPAIIEYRVSPSPVFSLAVAGPAASSLHTRLTKVESGTWGRLTDVAGDGQAYTATATNAQGLYLFTPNITNIGTAPTLSINNTPPRTLKDANGGGIEPGMLRAGYRYLIMFDTASSSYFVLTFPAYRARILSAYRNAIVTSSADSPNTVAMTIDGGLGDGTQLTFEPVAENTGAVTLVITDIYGNTNTRNLLKGANSPLSGGELRANQPATVQWRGAPQNNFKLLYSGDQTTAIQNLNKDVSALKSSLTDPYAALSDKLVGTGDTAVQFPFGKISWSAGVKTVTKQRIICTSIGSSVGTGAGSGDNAKYAPNAMFVAALQNELANYGEFEIIDDNQCIPTQAFQQFSAQLDNSPYATSDFVLIVGGMNDAPPGNFNMGLTFPRQKTTLEALIDKCLARGAIPIVCTSPHHNVEMPQTAPTIPGGNPLFWPFRTYSVVSTYVFDATANTIMNGYFASPVYGGDILSPGHSLRVDSGDNMGTYTITAISTDRTTITVQEPIPVSGSIPTTVRHFNLQSIAEDVLYPPPSKSVVSKDWTGGGVITQGDVRFEMMNNMQRSSARKKGAFVAECEIASFKYGVEVGGYSSIFNVPAGNYNHLNANGYTVSYGYPLTAAARKLVRLVFGEKHCV